MRQRGFTLIEIMIVVAIVGILSAVAIPSYSDYLVRAALPEATNALSDQRVRMEQFYADNRGYANGGACGVVMPNNLEKFTLACAITNAGQGYTITATGRGATNANGFVYTIDQANNRVTVSFGASWGSVPAVGATRWLVKKS